MQQKVALAMFAILLISNIGASAPANENVLRVLEANSSNEIVQILQKEI